jgi:hypothetical protein
MLLEKTYACGTAWTARKEWPKMFKDHKSLNTVERWMQKITICRWYGKIPMT